MKAAQAKEMKELVEKCNEVKFTAALYDRTLHKIEHSEELTSLELASS